MVRHRAGVVALRQAPDLVLVEIGAVCGVRAADVVRDSDRATPSRLGARIRSP
jgi:hypothetical protein